MKGLEEACIIHSADHYAQAQYFREFLKWTGISYFEYVYQEKDEQLNDSILDQEKQNHFDFILYIAEEKKTVKWKEKFQNLSNVHLPIELEGIWQREGELLKEEILKKYWEKLLKKVSPDNSVLKNLFNVLIKQYCKEDLLRILLNNRYDFWTDIDETDNEEKRKEKYVLMHEAWERVICNLEEHVVSTRNEMMKDGEEYNQYALFYCKRKVNELCTLLKIKLHYDTGELLEQIDNMYARGCKFYMMENLKSQIADIDSAYRVRTISYIKNCARACKVDACNSFHYYRLGKKYERIERSLEATRIYAISWQKNELNFRSLFKLAVDYFVHDNLKKASELLFKILKILQVYESNELDLEQIKKLPFLELEYASKCFVLLGRIAEELNRKEASHFYYEKVLDIAKSKPEENIFVQEMYPESKGNKEDKEDKEMRCVAQYLENRLRKETIEKRLEKGMGKRNGGSNGRT